MRWSPLALAVFAAGCASTAPVGTAKPSKITAREAIFDLWSEDFAVHESGVREVGELAHDVGQLLIDDKYPAPPKWSVSGRPGVVEVLFALPSAERRRVLAAAAHASDTTRLFLEASALRFPTDFTEDGVAFVILYGGSVPARELLARGPSGPTVDNAVRSRLGQLLNRGPTARNRIFAQALIRHLVDLHDPKDASLLEMVMAMGLYTTAPAVTDAYARYTIGAADAPAKEDEPPTSDSASNTPATSPLTGSELRSESLYRLAGAGGTSYARIPDPSTTLDFLKHTTAWNTASERLALYRFAPWRFGVVSQLVGEDHGLDTRKPMECVLSAIADRFICSASVRNVAALVTHLTHRRYGRSSGLEAPLDIATQVISPWLTGTIPLETPWWMRQVHRAADVQRTRATLDIDGHSVLYVGVGGRDRYGFVWTSEYYAFEGDRVFVFNSQAMAEKFYRGALRATGEPELVNEGDFVAHVSSDGLSADISSTMTDSGITTTAYTKTDGHLASDHPARGLPSGALVRCGWLANNYFNVQGDEWIRFTRPVPDALPVIDDVGSMAIAPLGTGYEGYAWLFVLPDNDRIKKLLGQHYPVNEAQPLMVNDYFISRANRLVYASYSSVLIDRAIRETRAVNTETNEFADVDNGAVQNLASSNARHNVLAPPFDIRSRVSASGAIVEEWKLVR